MRVKHDASKCGLSGMCALTAPEIFSQDENDGSIVVLLERPTPDLREKARQAAYLCPTHAISVEDDEASASERGAE